MKYAIVTFGCRVNQADSLDLDAALRARGLERAEPEQADLVVVNTCSVTAAADQGARHAIRSLRRHNPATRIIATGCYATREPEAVGGLPGVIRLVPNTEKAAFEAILDRELAALAGPAGWEDAGLASREAAGAGPGTLGRTAATLRVQTGCNEACAYCVIPFTRGPSRSRPAEDVVADFDALVQEGYAEVVVTGVHLGSYGRDLAPSLTLSVLLSRMVPRVTGPGRPLLRVSSVEPMDVTDDLLGLVAGSPTFAQHWHLPLQHASDRVLRAMRRPYRQLDFARLLERVRAQMPDAAIGSDVMVGFPGETDEDHAAQAQFLESSELTHLHVFPYSERPGTEAATLVPKVPQPVAARRAEELRSISRRLHERFVASHVGKVRPGLVLRSGTRVMTDNYLTVSVDKPRVRNERVRIRITSASPLRGEVVE